MVKVVRSFNLPFNLVEICFISEVRLLEIGDITASYSLAGYNNFVSSGIVCHMYKETPSTA